MLHKLAWYWALNGINILLLSARLLKHVEFQPQLGVLSRSLAVAAPDLIHFCLMCGATLVSFAVMAHLILGNAIQVRVLVFATIAN